MQFTDAQRKLLAYWGEIQQAVAQRVGTAELWNVVRSAAAAEGADLGGAGATDMGVLRSLAARQRNAMANLMGQRPEAAITGEMISQDVSARSLADQALAPRWIVRFEHDVTINGELQTVWRSSLFDESLPTTQGALRSALEQDAEAMADDYGVTHLGVGRFQISAA